MKILNIRIELRFPILNRKIHYVLSSIRIVRIVYFKNHLMSFHFLVEILGMNTHLIIISEGDHRKVIRLNDSYLGFCIFWTIKKRQIYIGWGVKVSGIVRKRDICYESGGFVHHMNEN